MPDRLKPKDLAAVRAELLGEQQGICPLCKREPVVPCLDHNHKTGAVRAVLCRGCNLLEGRYSNSVPRCQVPDPIAYLRNLADYLELHLTNQTGLIHPKHKTPGGPVRIRRKKRLKIGA